MLQPQFQDCSQNNDKELVLAILKNYFNNDNINPSDKLNDLGVNQKELLIYLASSNPRPNIVLETALGLDPDIQVSKNFIGKPRKINTVNDLLSGVSGVTIIG